VSKRPPRSGLLHHALLGLVCWAVLAAPTALPGRDVPAGPWQARCLAEPAAAGAARGLRPLRGRQLLGKSKPRPTQDTRTTSLSEVDGARLLFEAIGHIGNEDLPRAIAVLIPFTAAGGIQAAGHRQEASFYMGVALQRGGLPLLAGRSFAAAMTGQDAELAGKALAQVQALEAEHNGISLLLELTPDGAAVPLPTALRARVELGRAIDLLRAGQDEPARALLAAIPATGRSGVRTRLLRSTLLPPAEGRALVEELLSTLGEAPLPERAALLLHAGRMAYNQDRPEQALGFFTRIDPASPQHGDALLGAAWARQRLGRHAEALRTLFALSARAETGAGGGRREDAVPALPVGARPLAALIYLEACELDRAESMLGLAVPALELQLQLLDRALTGDPQRLSAALDDPAERPLLDLLLRAGDEWLPALRAALAEEGRLLASDRTPVRFRRTPVGRALLAEHKALQHALDRRAEVGLRRRAELERQATRAWLRTTLSLQHELLSRRQEAVRGWLTTGTGDGERKPAPGPPPSLTAGATGHGATGHGAPGGWDFSQLPWHDPAVTGGTLRHGVCPLRKS